ncbi:MAG: response regulator transcription factor [Cellulomonas sp.]|uniref:response regulator transcription factor n=1 Tax=Cellulomonas sp. TaxID=40001 RepID=UPI0019F333BD|nr:response regulator transcription factor [Cellulomonas sp.]MBF0688247.1 response regulator transcription factor [Cellulomonas sp.]
MSAGEPAATAVVLRPRGPDDLWAARFATFLARADGIGPVLTRPLGSACVVGGRGVVVHVVGLPARLEPGSWLARHTACDGAAVMATADAATIAEVMAMFRVGVRGFLHTSSPPEEVVTAVRAVAQGHPFVPPILLPEVVRVTARRPAPPPVVPLTEREHDVLRHLALGRSNPQVADALFIAPATVRTHVLSILRKLGARNRTEAVVRAYRTGLLDVQLDDTDLDGQDAVSGR